MTIRAALVGAEMEDGEAAQLGCSGEVDPHRLFPRGEPGRLVLLDRGGFEDAGIVHQHIDPPVEPGQRLVPQGARRAGLRQIGGDACASPLLLEWPMTLCAVSAVTIEAPMPRLEPVTRMWRVLLIPAR